MTRIQLKLLIVVIGAFLFLFGGCLMLAGTWGLIPTPPWCPPTGDDEYETPSVSLAILVGFAGSIIAAAGAVTILRTIRSSAKPLSIFESSDPFPPEEEPSHFQKLF